MNAKTKVQKYQVNLNVFRGFTLVELIVILVILGIISATAIPKFLDMSDSSRTAKFDSLKSIILSTADAVHAQHLRLSTNQNDPLTIDGQTINMVNGYPAISSIGMLIDPEGFSYDNRAWWYTRDSLNCRVEYNEAGDPSNPTIKDPDVVYETSGC